MRLLLLPGFCRGPVLALVLFLGLAPARAQVVVLSNLVTPTTQSTVSSTAFKAQAFAVAAGSDYLVNSVTLNFAAATNTSGNFTLSIYSDSAGPGALLGGGLLTGEANPGTAGTYTYTPGGSLQLTAGATYWLVAGVSSGAGSYRWSIGPNTYPTAVWTQVDKAGSSGNSGTSWSSFTTTTPYQFEISATAIPEPSTYAALAGLGALGLALWHRRRKALAAAGV